MEGLEWNISLTLHDGGHTVHVRTLRICQPQFVPSKGLRSLKNPQHVFAGVGAVSYLRGGIISHCSIVHIICWF